MAALIKTAQRSSIGQSSQSRVLCLKEFGHCSVLLNGLMSFFIGFVDYLGVCHGHREALHPLLGLGGVLGLQNESLVCSEDLKGLGDVPAALDVDTADAADIDREDALLLSFVLVSKASPGEGEVATFPLLEDLPLPSFLLLELTLNDGFLLGDEG